jgi:hypothetical protein
MPDVWNLAQSVLAQRTPGGEEGAVVLTGSATKPGVGVGDAAARVGSSGAAGGVAEGAISLIGSGNLCSEFATSGPSMYLKTIRATPRSRAQFRKILITRLVRQKRGTFMNQFSWHEC